MIDKVMLLRYFLESLLAIPAGVMAFLPLFRSMRNRSPFYISSMFIFSIATSFIVALICTKYHLETSIVMIPFYPIFYMFYSAMIARGPIKKLFCFVNSVLFIAFNTMYTGYVMAPVEQFNPDPVRTIPTSLVCLAGACIMVLVFYFTVSKDLAVMLDDPQLNYIWYWLIFIPLVFTAVVLFATPRNFEAIMVGRIQAISLVSMMLIPIATLLSYHLIYILSSRLKDYSRLQQENTLLKLEEKRYEQIRSFMEQSRAVRHDFRQHLLVIAGLARKNENQRLIEYISPLISQSNGTSRHFCANMTVDAVAAHYDEIAESQETKIDWSLELPNNLPIHESDVCSILGNFLENALSAVKDLPVSQRIITAGASMITEETIGISVKNPFQGTVKFRRNGLPRNTRIGHGIGLESVSMITQKYHGSLSLSADGGVFSAGVLLYTDTDPKEQEDI